MAFRRGEFIWVDFNPQSGREQSGRRPALVISPAEYNAVSNCVLVCPVTGNTSPWPWKVAIPQGNAIEGAVLVDQVKSIDARARHAESVGVMLDELSLQEVLARLATLTG
jgi:mRNA interferase MazF